jgi:hypothetical protein
MDELRTRTAEMLGWLTDEQVMLVQDYVRYLRDMQRVREGGHALEDLLEETA